jgi:hypothetical protein
VRQAIRRSKDRLGPVSKAPSARDADRSDESEDCSVPKLVPSLNYVDECGCHSENHHGRQELLAGRCCRFAIVAILQLFRALSGWDITLNGAAIPLWASWLAAVFAGALAFVGLTVRR